MPRHAAFIVNKKGRTSMRKQTLENGVRVVVHPMNHTRSVSIGVWIEVGSRYETPEQAGMAHFIEHMLFKGTKTRSAKDLAIAFDRIGGNSNAYTSKEQTCYYTRVLDRYAIQAIDLLADMLWNSVFDPEEMEREKQVIAEEIHMVEDTPDDCVHEYLWETIFQSHLLAQPILGTQKTVASFTREQVVDFYQKAYHPSKVIISIAGNVDHALLDHLEKQFGTPNWERQELPTITPGTFHVGEIQKEREIEQVHVTLAWPSPSVLDADIYAIVLLQTMLGGSMSSRLFQSIREEKGLAYSIYCYQTSYVDSGVFAIYGGTSKDQLNELLEAVHECLDEVATNGFTAEELEDAKTQIEANLYLSLESSTTWMNRLARNEILYGTQQDVESYLEKYRAVSCEDILRVSQMFTKKPAKSIIQPYSS